MNRDEPRDERSHAGRHVEPGGDVYDDEISLQPLLKTLWSYRQVASLAVAGVMGIFVVAMLAAYVSQAVERLGTLEFRLCTSSNQSGPLRLRRKRDFLPLCRVVRRPLILSPSCS